MTLYKRPGSKYWWMKFTFDGALVQRSTMVANKRDAQTVESAFRTQLALGKIGIEPKKEIPTFEKYLDDFLKWLKVEHAGKPTSYKRYYFSSLPLKKFFGKAKVDRLSLEQIKKYVVWRSAQKSRKTKQSISRETVNIELTVLKTLFENLVKDKILSDNPARSVKRLPENERAFHVISLAEEKSYLPACPQPLKDVAALMLATGMRCNEVYQLRRQDVSYSDGFLKVTKGKTRSSIRKVHLSKQAVEILSARCQKFAGDNLFPQNEMDGAAATGTLNHLHRKVIEKLGYKFRLYDCRHSFASRAAESGMDLLTLSQLLGHSSLKMVTRYAHPSESHKQAAMRQFEKKRLKAG